MLNRSASLAMSTSVLKALTCKLDIKRHSPSILYLISQHEGSSDPILQNVRYSRKPGMYVDEESDTFQAHDPH